MSDQHPIKTYCVLTIRTKDILEKIAEHGGKKNQDYYDALSYIQRKTRDEGIDAALKHVTENGEEIQLDALILCDRRLVGQQIAAQAGQLKCAYIHGSSR
jgi:hypothetical protein